MRTTTLILTPFLLLYITAAPSAWATPPPLLADPVRHTDREHGAPGLRTPDIGGAPAPVASEGGSRSFGALRDWLEGEHMSGEWAGLRTALEDLGLTVAATHVFDWSKPFSGGSNKRDTARGLVDLNLSFDLERIANLSGGTLFFDGYAIWGRAGSEDTGDFHGYSNIDSSNRTQVAELWYQQVLFGDRLRIKIGKADGNSEFAFVDTAGDFINSAAGFSPTIFVLPTYPDPAMSVNVFVYPTKHLYLGVGVYDGDGAEGVATGRRGPKNFFSDSSFVIAEGGLLWDNALSGGNGRLAAGAWYHDAEFARFDGGTDDHATGFFALVEHQVWREKPQEDDEQGVGLFIQYGFADEDVSEAVHHVGVGAMWNGPIPMRDRDAVGLMLSWIDLSDEAGSGFTANETLLEAFYLAELTPFLGAKLDLQYIANPSGVSSATDVVVGTLRIEVGF